MREVRKAVSLVPCAEHMRKARSTTDNEFVVCWPADVFLSLSLSLAARDAIEASAQIEWILILYLSVRQRDKTDSINAFCDRRMAHDVQ
jgi:hypothetical protein